MPHIVDGPANSNVAAIEGASLIMSDVLHILKPRGKKVAIVGDKKNS